MDLVTLQAALENLPLGGLRYLPVTGSTNDEALRWGRLQAPDLAIVVADEQTAGRGRSGRRWHTPAGTALAVSVVLRADAFIPSLQGETLLRLTGLGALSICLALHSLYGLQAQVKWPNDVLLEHRKVAGVLAELSWRGNTWEYAIIGMGVNVQAAALPPADALHFPAIAVESVAGHPVQRTALLYEILHHLVTWRQRLHTAEFLHLWESHLAWKGRTVTLWQEGKRILAQGRLLGLDSSGALRLQTPQGIRSLRLGEMRLRPAAVAPPPHPPGGSHVPG